MYKTKCNNCGALKFNASAASSCSVCDSTDIINEEEL